MVIIHSLSHLPSSVPSLYTSCEENEDIDLGVEYSCEQNKSCPHGAYILLKCIIIAVMKVSKYTFFLDLNDV